MARSIRFDRPGGRKGAAGVRIQLMLEGLQQKWREDVATLRRYGAVTHAQIVEMCAFELHSAVTEWELEQLTLAQSVEESGYGYSALQKMVASGELENVGSKGAPRIRRRDLPKKAGTVTTPGLADTLLAKRIA